MLQPAKNRTVNEQRVHSLMRTIWFASIVLIIVVMSGCMALPPPIPTAFPTPTFVPSLTRTHYAVTSLPTYTAFPTLISRASQTPSPSPTALTLPTVSTAKPDGSTPVPHPTPDLGSPAVWALGVIPPPFPLFEHDGQINVLLLGTDKPKFGSYRTDTIIIASIQSAHNLVTLISVPRDFYVYIPDWRMQRINTAHYQGEANQDRGGNALIADTIAYNLGITIDFVAMIDFNAFKQGIDTLGGIDVPVMCRFEDKIVLEPGIHHMDGATALTFVRGRKGTNDFDRNRRQQDVLRAIYEQAVSVNALSRVPALYQDFSDLIQTDIQLQDAVALVRVAHALRYGDIRNVYLDKPAMVSRTTEKGAQVQMPDRYALYDKLHWALTPPEGPPTISARVSIVLENASGTPEHGELAAAELRKAGFHVTNILVNDTIQQNTSIIERGIQTDPVALESLSTLFTVPAEQIFSETDLSEGAAFRVILGADYDPCRDR